MPVLTGVDLADASGVGLLDGVAALLGEANLDFSAILTALNIGIGKANLILTALSLVQTAMDALSWLNEQETELVQFLQDYGASTPFNQITALTAAMADLRSATARPLPNTMYNLGNIYDAIAAGGGANPDILAAIAAVRGAGNPDLAAVLTAIAGIPGIGPTEYTAIAAYVWGKWLDNALDPTLTADQAVTVAAMDAIGRGQVGAFKQIGDPNFHVEWQSAPYYAAPESYTSAKPDYSDILPGDTVLSWLQRTETVRGGWELDTATGLAVSYTVLSGEHIYRTVCDLRDLELHALAIRTGPPVWPGEAGITRGTSVPLAAGVVLSGTMHGVEIYITATERAIPFVSADTFKLYKSLGRYTFVNDAGDLEPWQPIPADVAQLMPKAMAVAAGCLLSFYTGVTGTVTPFTINT
jgi:hypothetical protein